MKAFYMIIFLGLITKLSSSQTTFQKEIFTTTEKLRICNIEKIGDGSFIFIANGEEPHTTLPTDGHYFIAKVDSLGNLLWSKSYINSIFSWSTYTNIQKYNDSSFVVLSNGSLMKFKNDGQLEYKKTYKDSIFATLDNLYQTNDNGILLAGRTNPNLVVLIKTDSIGHVLWSRDFNIGFRPTPYYIFNAGSGNSLLTGSYQDSLGSLSKVFMILIDTSGQIINAMEIHRPGTMEIFDMAFDPNLSFVYFTTHDSIIHQDIIGKINTINGQVIWTKFINNYIKRITFENDTINLLGRDVNNYFILKLDTAGIPHNSVAWSGTSDLINFICRENKFIVLSSELISIHYVQFDKDSLPLCEQPPPNFTINSTSGYVVNTLNIGSSIRNFSDSTISVTIVNDNYVFHNSCIPQNLAAIENEKELFEIYPQPAHDYISVKYFGAMQNDFAIMIFDIFGKLIDSKNIDFYSANPIILSTQEIPRGSYIFCLKDKNEVVFRRPLILE